MNRNRQLKVKHWPDGLPGPEHFELVEAPIPEPGDAQILIRNLWLSTTPTIAMPLAHVSWVPRSAGRAT